ncbi:MAG: HIT domain-containing protein [Alphaproteobacteria bacterium]|nr:HIT domain-containing protein [Alphaproteobacteria bacterium]
MTFSLHPQLAADTHLIGDLPACRLLLMNNSSFPWVILVPRKDGLRELFDLSAEDYTAVMAEVRLVSEAFASETRADKMNIAALGNMVPQLHIHIIARYKTDAAWPNPVWNSGIAATPYHASELSEKLAQLRIVFNITKM